MFSTISFLSRVYVYISLFFGSTSQYSFTPQLIQVKFFQHILASCGLGKDLDHQGRNAFIPAFFIDLVIMDIRLNNANIGL